MYKLLYKRSLELKRERAKYVKVGIFLFTVYAVFVSPKIFISQTLLELANRSREAREAGGSGLQQSS